MGNHCNCGENIKGENEISDKMRTDHQLVDKTQGLSKVSHKL